MQQQVTEVDLASLESSLRKVLQEPVRIGSATAEQEGCFFRAQWTFETEFAGKGANASLPVSFLALPSLVLTSMIEDNLPPSLSGIPLLYNSSPRTNSASTAEKNPKRWVGL